MEECKNEDNHSNLLSELATNDQHGENSPYFEGWKAYDSDPFHPTKNPNGVIQMGLAENQLSTDLIEEWIEKNPKASICSNEGVHIAFKDIALYQDYHGLPEFRNAIARFMAKARGERVSFDPDRIVMAGGATGANETLMFCLADPGDGFLIPTPYYPAFDRDLRWRPKVQLIPVTCESSNSFRITEEALEEAYERARRANIRVKGLIIANPSNPLGTTLSRSTLKSLIEFVGDKRIHLVCDEIYASTVFRSPEFVSVSELVEESKACSRELIHIVYSLSKDMGLPGFRVGVVYSYNDQVVSCARRMSSFGLVSSQTQHLLASMLSDEAFVDNFLSESRRRLMDRHDRFRTGLSKLGIGCLESNAGLFCWMDLRGLLENPSFEGELGLWRVVIGQVKLNVSPGSSFHCHEPGWFRVCFANMDDETVNVALRRIRNFVGRRRDEAGRKELEAKKKKALRVSFPSSSSLVLYDEKIASSSSLPCVMSPHSPLPRSPLLGTRT